MFAGRVDPPERSLSKRLQPHHPPGVPALTSLHLVELVPFRDTREHGGGLAGGIQDREVGAVTPHDLARIDHVSEQPPVRQRDSHPHEPGNGNAANEGRVAEEADASVLAIIDPQLIVCPTDPYRTPKLARPLTSPTDDLEWSTIGREALHVVVQTLDHV